MNKIDHERLTDIHSEMMDLIEEASSLVRSNGGIEWERANGYWVAQIKMALSNDHFYVGSSMFTMQDAIQSLDPGDEEECAEEECDEEECDEEE